MVLHSKTFYFGFLFLATFVFTQSVEAQNNRLKNEIIGHAKNVAAYCTPGLWTTNRCYKVLANSNKVLAANYMAELHGKNHMQQKKRIEEECAASTALGEVMGLTRESAASAMTQCYNALTEVADELDMVPNPDHAQLFVAALYCYRDDIKAEACPEVEKSLAKYR